MLSVTSDTLEIALSISRTDLGDVQLLDPEAELVMVAQAGFGDALLQRQASAADAEPAGVQAARRHTQIVLPDPTRDGPDQHITATAGLGAVQATPMVDSSDRTVGVLSTYFRHSRPDDRQLESLVHLGKLAGAALSPLLGPAGDVEQGDADEVAELRRRAAELQNALISRIVIEQAKGVLAAAFGITPDEAFHRLRRYARDHNQKLHDMADAVVRGRIRP